MAGQTREVAPLTRPEGASAEAVVALTQARAAGVVVQHQAAVARTDSSAFSSKYARLEMQRT